MTKNRANVINEEGEQDSSALQLYLEARDPITLIPHDSLTTLQHALWALQIMKKGLVGVRGGRQLKDKGFFIYDTNLDTEYFVSVLRPFIRTELVRPGKCSPFYQQLFYEPDRKRKSKEVDEGESAKQGVTVYTEVETTVVNNQYIPGRSVMLVPYDSATSAVYLTLAYLELVLDSFPEKTLASIPASVALDAYAKAGGWKVEDFVRNAKYITAYPIAKFLKQSDLPERPASLESYVFFRGAIAKIIRARLISSRDHKAARFFFGLLQGVKRACNVVPMAFITKAKEKHLLTLTRPTASIDTGYLEGEFSKLAHRLFNGVKLDSRHITAITEPSKSASYEAKRTDGGQDVIVREALGVSQTPYHEAFLTTQELQEGDYNNDPSVSLLTVDPNELLDFIEEEGVLNQELDEEHDTYYRASLGKISFYDELHSMHETNEGVRELRGHYVSRAEKYELVKTISKAIRDSARPINCNIVPLSEPLKVRIISAGEGLPYYLAKPFQKVVWKWLRRFPQFVVIGETLSSDILSRMLDRESALQGFINQQNSQRQKWKTPIPNYPTTFFVSGDYSAATDNLKIEYTLQCFDTLMGVLLAKCKSEYSQDMPILQAYLQLMRALLEPHNLCYNDKDGLLEELCRQHQIPYTLEVETSGKTVLKVRQENGQLMGSPISFPFLCAINFICYWTSVNRYLGCHVPHRLLPVLVNGDDILFRSNDRHYAIWKEIIAEVGFTLSLGKNYTHTNYLTINSELYEYRERPGTEDEFLKLDYFNVGLLIAQSKGRLADPSRRLSLVELYASSVGCAINKPQAHRHFMLYNKKQLDEATDRGKFNCFLPIPYGGLGFPVYPEVFPEIYVTQFQRRFAAFLLKRTNEQLLLGKYPKKYFAALLTDTTPLQSLVRRSGVRELRLSSNQYEGDEWERFLPDPVLTMGAFSAANEILDEPSSEYRLPARSLLKEFNKEHFKAFHTTEVSYLQDEMSNEQLLSCEPLLLWARRGVPRAPPLKTWLPS